MPKRLIDYDALWTSGKLSNCKPSHRVEYLWIYGLADAGGSFEMTNLRALWGKVAPIRPDLTIEKLKNALRDFQKHGLLYVWKSKEKIFGHWVGSRYAGRLPPPSQRQRYFVLCPEPDKELLLQYETAFESSHSLDCKLDKDMDLDGIRMVRGWVKVLERDNPAQGVPSSDEKPGIGFRPNQKLAAEAERQKEDLDRWLAVKNQNKPNSSGL